MGSLIDEIYSMISHLRTNERRAPGLVADAIVLLRKVEAELRRLYAIEAAFSSPPVLEDLDDEP